MTDFRPGQPQVVSSFRRWLQRQGFKAVTIESIDSSLLPGKRYLVSFFDDLDNMSFCRTYTLEDMCCIVRGSDIFWRFIK